VTTHELKTLPDFYRAICAGVKKFEIRRDDRGFALGDILLLKEWQSFGYTGEEKAVQITYLLRGHEGLSPGFVIMGIEMPGQIR
jgi:hypothetical protein